MVFVLSKQKKPLNMCTPAKARVLLKNGHAVVHKVYPFTIRLKGALTSLQEPKEYKLKIDPGSTKTGIAIVESENNVVLLTEIEHFKETPKRGRKVQYNNDTIQKHRNNTPKKSWSIVSPWFFRMLEARTF